MLDIIQGEQQPFKIDLKSKKTGLPFDLTGNVEIEVCFKGGSSIIIKKKTLGQVIVDNLVLGQISGFIEVGETNAMTPLTDGSIEVLINFDGDPVAQVVNVDVTLSPDGTYTIVINNVDFSFVAAGNNEAEISAGLIAAINAGSQPVTATPGAGDSLDITANEPGIAFISALGSNPNTSMVLTTLIANVSPDIKKAQFINAYSVTAKICP